MQKVRDSQRGNSPEMVKLEVHERESVIPIRTGGNRALVGMRQAPVSCWGSNPKVKSSQGKFQNCT